ncbi:N-acetylmuramoyl-L-alanine amidase [Streptomyces sp. 549]|uniref:peptidoglycan recognition protein family protein n=1 Tax=Streptomyces sp. 549 TaxID=3049076 RepID=UPI0024C30C95|nr:N-acetylmuramoyl-L-alanine amidase [Streptomyces sp. 549]MDK1473266.1 N-acetylmuramoyl-L-alanine amidase [Streptomyces sp. 549]
MATFVTRAQWGARAPKKTSTDIDPSRGGVAVHHTGATRFAAGAHSSCAAQVRGIQKHHMDDKGWDDVAYTYLVCVHGSIYEGRGVGLRTAANGTNDSNHRYYAVCGLVGGTSSSYDTVTSALIDGFRTSIARLRSVGGAATGITGHRAFLATECPGRLGEHMAAMEPGSSGGGPTDPPPSGAPPWPGVLLHYPPVTVHSSARTWQQQMKRRGWTLTVDGAYGEQSRRVCLAFQQEKGLTVDGVVGEKTWNASWTAPVTAAAASARSAPEASAPDWPGVLFTAPPRTVHPGVRVWQRRMRERDWGVPVDGTYDRRSREACVAFQQQHGLTPDGVVGPATWHAAWTAPSA